MKFASIERRISANAEGTKFRVQYTDKKKKAKAKVLSSIAEARVFRDKTDKPGAGDAKTKIAKGLKVAKKGANSKINKNLQIMQLDIPEGVSVSSDKKMQLLEKFLNGFEKILAL